MTEAENKREKKNPRDKWLDRIKREEKAHEDYRKKAKDACEAYNDPKAPKSFPVYWSTVEVTRAAIFAREAKPDVRKRYGNMPKEADNIATAIERGLIYYQDCGEYFVNLSGSVLDLVVQGLGLAKVELETETVEIPVIDPTTGAPIKAVEGEKPPIETAIRSQKVHVKQWPAARFHWEPAPSWEKVGWIAFDHELTAQEILEQFEIDLEEKDKGGDGGEGKRRKTTAQKYTSTHTVHEIWDRKSKSRIFVSSCWPDVLDDEPDPLGLEGFYPTPRPMMIGVSGEDLCPSPDYQHVEKTCKHIETLTRRIRSLTGAIRDVGLYDATIGPELERLSTLNDGERIAVKGLIDRLNQSGSGRAAWDAVIADPDNRSKVEVLVKLVEQRDVSKNELFETLGISDIIRGTTVASETARAQEIKGQWANVRIGPKIREVSRYNRDTLRLAAEVFCEHLDPQQIMQATGVELTPEEVEVLRSDESRQYSVDIETDATLAQDEAEEKQGRTELYNTVMQHANTTFPAVQQGVMPADFAKGMLDFVVSSHKYGRSLRDVIEQLPDSQEQLQQLQQQVQQAQQETQQAQQQLQQVQAELAKFQQGKEQRETADTEATVTLKNAQARKADADVERAMSPDPQAPVEDRTADDVLKLSKARQADAETQKTQVETALAPRKIVADMQSKREALAARTFQPKPAPPI